MDSRPGGASARICKLGLIAGNGRFPLLVLEQALRQRIPVTVAAIREETGREIELLVASAAGAEPPRVTLHWLGLGQLGTLLRIFKEEGVDKAIMAGQVKHVRVFARGASSALKGLLESPPDLRMLRLVASLPRKDTSSLIAAIAQVLEDEGIELVDSTLLVKHLLPLPGVLTRRRPNREEARDVQYGTRVARELARIDLGQTVVIKDQVIVAVEAMEGTDETIRRAARLVHGQRLTVVKAARPQQDMRFDVPVIGIQTLCVCQECNVSALGIDAGKTLMVEGDEFVAQADRQGMAVVAG